MGRPHRYYENRILRRYFDTERRLQEVQSVGGCDGHSNMFAIELFQRNIPNYLIEELEQAEDDDAGGDLTPLVVWHEKGTPHDDDLVIMRQSDFQDFLDKQGIEP